MKFSPKPAVALLFLLVVISLGLKLALPQTPEASPRENDEKTDALGAFLAAQGMKPEPVALRKNWAGWKITTPSCRAIAAGDIFASEGENAIRLLLGPGDIFRFVFHGHILEQYPTLAMRLEQARNRFFFSFRPTGWRTPLVVVLVMPRQCRPVETLPWQKLWQQSEAAGPVV